MDETTEQKALIKEKRKLNYAEALINMIKCILGAGLLGAPYGFAQLGWLLGSFIATFIIFLITYSERILLASIRDVCRLREVEYLDYSEAMREGLKEGPSWLQKGSNVVAIMVQVFIALFHFGCGPAYIVVIANSLRDVVGYYYMIADVRLYMALMTPLVIMVYLINNLKAVTPFSLIATFCIFTGLSAVVYYIVNTHLRPFTDLKLAQCPSCIPLYVGLVLLCNASPGVVLAIDAEMKKREQFLSYFGVFNIGMLITYIIFIAFSLLGYWHYGAATRENILLNIPFNEIVSHLTKIVYAIAIFFSYPLQLYPVIHILWTQNLKLKAPPNRHVLYEMLLRAAVVIVSVIVAILVPFFDIIASFNGCLSITILGFFFPALLDICLRYSRSYGPAYIILIRDIFLIVVAIFFFLSGIIMTIISIINKFKH